MCRYRRRRKLFLPQASLPNTERGRLHSLHRLQSNQSPSPLQSTILFESAFSFYWMMYFISYYSFPPLSFPLQPSLPRAKTVCRRFGRVSPKVYRTASYWQTLRLKFCGVTMGRTRKNISEVVLWPSQLDDAHYIFILFSIQLAWDKVGRALNQMPVRLTQTCIQARLHNYDTSARHHSARAIRHKNEGGGGFLIAKCNVHSTTQYTGIMLFDVADCRGCFPFHHRLEMAKL